MSRVTALFSTVLLTVGYCADQLCPEKQFLELGESDIIRCSFEAGYFGIYWYDTNDLTQQPILYNADGETGGSAYMSGEYSLASNGSLLINHVTTEHERDFVVVVIDNLESENLVTKTIGVNVLAHPRLPYPVIDRCISTRYCYTKINSNDIFGCTVNGTRPPVHLSWLVRTIEGDSDVTYQRKYSPDGDLNTTTATMWFRHISPLHLYLFVCSADNTTPVLGKLTSFIVAEVDQHVTELDQSIVIQMENSDSIILSCGGDNALLVVWKREVSDTQYDVIAHGYGPAGMKFTEPPYKLDNDGGLMFRQFSYDHDGVYICIASNGIQEWTVIYELVRAPLFTHTTLSNENIMAAAEENKPVVIIVVLLCLIVLFVVAGMVLYFTVIRRKRCRVKKTNRTDNSVAEENVPLHSDKEHTISDKSVADGNEPPISMEDHKNDKADHQKQTTSKQEENPCHSRNYIQIKKYTVDNVEPGREEKVIVFVDGSDIERTKLDWDIVKYFMGAKCDDEVEYNVEDINEFEKSVSQTIDIKMQVFTINGEFSLKLMFDITFVVIHDYRYIQTGDSTMYKEITEQLYYLTICEAYQLKHVDAVVLVQGISKVPSFPPKSILFHPVFRLFGKDLFDNVHLIITCNSEEGFPNYTATDKKGEYPIAVHFLSSKGKLKKQNCVNVKCTSSDIFWDEKSKSNFKNFSKSLANTHPTSLVRSINVLVKRKELEEKLSKMSESIAKSIRGREELKKEEFVLVKLDSAKISLPHEEQAMICTQCSNVCPCPCSHGDIDTCSCIEWDSPDGRCGVCQNNCPPNSHEKCSHRFKKEKDAKRKDQESVMNVLKDILQKQNGFVCKYAENINSYMEDLYRNALLHTVLSVERNNENIVVKEAIDEDDKWDAFLSEIKDIFPYDEIGMKEQDIMD